VEAPATVRLQLTVQYDGSAFHGWQVQPGQRTIQGALQETLARLADRPCTVVGSGRTDTGVHATGQVASVDMPADWTPEQLRRALNSTLPDDLWIQIVRAVTSDFHPRYDALTRTYTYSVGSSPQSASPFQRRWCWALCEQLDRSLLAEAAAHLPGEHSFEAFSKAGQPERGDRCRISAATWSDWELGARFTVSADRYLHHMVRYLVGTMVDVARNRRPLGDVLRLLDNDPDMTTSPPAPPEGLFLSHVEYPETVLLGSDPTTSPSRSTATA